ncbi:hypothetical protein CLOHIR_00686 [Peptacetobacter hiranonis DSM 13275]|uniref:Uncharacterized protein n=1 Tax=Peptacetobacter hiranonis (strain DSM 13275 / JCM 10541 / KCTC 15199 / TO-931) TaxID=500633 RepID=B6FXT5_PEPHT|nr:hypothetical protein CLOHIR_00686 [Peptacetobacter hiranonis DSM 13275]
MSLKRITPYNFIDIKFIVNFLVLKNIFIATVNKKSQKNLIFSLFDTIFF